MSEHARAEPVRGSAGASLLSAFLVEAAELWRRLPHKLLFLILLVAWLALFHYFGNATLGYTRTPSLFLWARSDYLSQSDDRHGMFMPLVVLLFLWVKRRELAELSPRTYWPALAYFCAAVLLHILAFRVQQTRISMLALILGLHAL